jgi:glycosyltransferase involved in cell wall biosynthesis
VVVTCDFFLRYSAMLAAGLGRAGAETTLLTRDHDLEFGGSPGAARDFIADAVGTGVEVRRIPGRMRSASGWRRAFEIRRDLKLEGPAIVHLQESVGNDIRLPLVAGIRRGRFALTVHDPVRHPGDSDVGWVRRLNRALVRSAGVIFVHGEALRAELAEVASPRAPIVVIPHGADPGKASALPEEPSVLFFGRLSRYKGIDVLLDSMELVWRALPEATLTIAGAGDLGRHPGLEDRRVVVRNAHVPDAEVPRLIRAARCVVLPYRQASQSGVGSLVKPYGRPLVVTSVGGLPELVADGSGLVVPPEDPEGLSEALVSVLRDDGLASRLAAAGAATAVRAGSWDAVAERTLAAYREHLGAGH